MANIMAGPPLSGIRKYFEKIEKTVGNKNEKYTCGICSTVVCSSPFATSNLIKHIKRRHSDEYEKYLKEGKKKTESHSHPVCFQTESFDSILSRSNTNSLNYFDGEISDENIHRLIRYLADSLIPISTVGSREFIQFVHGLNCNFVVPSPLYIQNSILPQAYVHYQNKVRHQLLQVADLCISVDVLTDSSNTYYLFIVASYISAEWTKEFVLLKCRMFKSCPSKSFILSTFEETITEMDVKYKIRSVVTGRIKNKNSVECLIHFPGWEPNFEFHQFPEDLIPSDMFDQLWEDIPDTQKCFNTTLDQVILHGIKELLPHQELFEKVSSACSVLENMGNSSHDAYSPITWTDQVATIKKYLQSHENESQLLSSLGVKSELLLTQVEKNILTIIVEVVEPFCDAIQRLQSCAQAGSSEVIPIIRGLRHHLQSQSLNSSIVHPLIESLSSILELYLASYESVEINQLASLLDPRFKMTWSTPEEQSSLREKLQSIVADHNVQYSNISQCKPNGVESDLKRPKLFSFMADKTSKPSSNLDEAVREEVLRFLFSPCKPHDVNPLDIWAGIDSDFPLIASVVRRAFCVEVSTTTIAEVFPEATSLSKGRLLEDDEFEKLCFIKMNIEQS